MRQPLQRFELPVSNRRSQQYNATGTGKNILWDVIVNPFPPSSTGVSIFKVATEKQLIMTKTALNTLIRLRYSG